MSTAAGPARIALAPDDSANRALIDAVHPPTWKNPNPAARYDLVVIGAGTAGLVTAAGAAGLGARVALVEKHLMGGDCLNVGCVPSKALISSARVAATARGGDPWGVTAREVTVDFAAVMARMRALRADIAPADSAARFQGLGVDVFLGAGRFTSRRTVDVGGTSLRFARAVIATGARASIPPIDGLERAGYLTNETVFELTELPARMVVIGGGPIGCELAQSLARFGAQVTVIEAGPALCGREEPAASAAIAASLERDGVRVLTDAEVVEVEPDRTVVVRLARDHDSGDHDSGDHDSGDHNSSDSSSDNDQPKPVAPTATERIDADAILVAAGRRPNVENLDLDCAGVTYSARGVDVDARLRSKNRRIYAAGDVASDYQFTHAADAMARIVLQNALFFGRRDVNRLIIPRVTYTDPEVAAVGLTAAEADRRGVAYSTFEVALSDVDRAIVDGHTDGFIRVHVRRGSDKIIGATLVAPHAGEAIGELSLAMSQGLGLGAIGGAIHAYPTVALGLRQVADQHSRTRLTPLVARILRALIALRRRF